MTIIAKVRLEEKQLDRSGIVAKGAGDAAQAGYSFMYRVPKKALYLYLSNGKRRTQVYTKRVIINDGKWHTVAVSLKRGDRVLFAVDGVVSSISGDTLFGEDISNRDANFFIGSSGVGNYLNGGISALRVYRQAFSKDVLEKMTK